MSRKAEIFRKTKETEIKISLDLDGKGKSQIGTGVPFFDHMLELFTQHGLFNLEISAQGDLEIDAHHTVEDTGIALGQALKKAVGDKAGIKRYGFFVLPMDEVLAESTLDLSGRPYLAYHVSLPYEIIGNFDTALVPEFFTALANEAGLTLHLGARGGNNSHHIIEGLFKAFARALDMATQIDPRAEGIPSTKGSL